MPEIRTYGGEYAVPPEHVLRRSGEYAPPPEEAFGPGASAGLPEEFPAPPPEFTPPGRAAPAAEKPDRKKKKRRLRLIYALFSAALVLTAVGPFRLFEGGNAAPPEKAPGTQSVQPGEPSGSEQTAPSSPAAPGRDALPAPELTASFTTEPGGNDWFWLDYNAAFRPAEGDDTDYAPEVYRFGTYCYDAGGGFLDSVYVSASGIPDVEPAERGFKLHYDGPANGEFPEGTETIAIWLQLKDANSGDIYEVITDASAPPETKPLAVPDCEIYLTSHFSEFRGKLLFRDMDEAETVTVELWDPETDSCDASFDVTEAALADGEYDIEPFSTDFVYEMHREYYEEKNAFPMQLRIRVLVDYRGEDGMTQAVFTAESMSEPGWMTGYVPSDTEAWNKWITPGCFQVQIKDCPAECQIIYGRDMPESAAYLFVSMEIDGEPVRIDPDALSTLHDEYDARTYQNGVGTDHHFHTTMLVIPMPEGYAEGEGHTARFTVRQYLSNAEKAVAFEQDVEF